MNDHILFASPDVAPLMAGEPSAARRLTGRIDARPENVERGLAQLVLTIVELLRQLMERQAVRRMDDGTLTDDQIENVGRTLMELDHRMQQLLAEFDISPEDLNLNLGPLGDLL